MKLLITGGAGFIGSTVVKLAIKRGFSVINIDALTYAASLDTLSEISQHSNYTFVNANICHRSAIDAVFEQYQPDGVMHLAAESHVDRSIDGPSEFIETNIMGTFNMLEAARAYWSKRGRVKNFRFHHVSTDEVFGSLPDSEASKFREDTPYDPRSPYSASKASSDHLVRAWYETYGLPVVLSNCSNNYGPYHFPEKLIPLVILSALAQRPLPIYGDGTNIRDWLFVDDHADALLLVFENGQTGRSYNIGGNCEISNLDLVKSICNILDSLKPLSRGSYAELITFVRDRPGHDFRYAIDAGRIKNELGWQPKTSLHVGLEKTVRWYIDNEAWWRPLLDRSSFGEKFGIDL